MGQAIEITRTDLKAEQLRVLAGRSHDGAVVRRLLAVALLLDGRSREEAATLNGMTRQTLRDWVHRYNAEGVAGLCSRTGPGRPPRLTPAGMEEFREMVVRGPDPERHMVVRWRCADLREELASRFSVTVCEQTVGRWLRELGMTRLQPRPYHPKKDPEAEAAFKKTSPPW
jgi:transposase